jgi:transcriptional regulator with PAS, ATPase and Fis domain
MDDHSSPALRGASNGQQRTPLSAEKSLRPFITSDSLRDWHFETNSSSRKIASIDRLVGESRTMTDLRGRITRYARTEATVLISGETGTGKELIARILHDLSRRNTAPFVAINCAAIPGPLAESELFGSTKGAFTGAVECRKGLLSNANGGTLFLDEFGELIPEVQSKLLRVLELGVYRPVGANREERVDVRIIAATNRDLERLVLCGKFRADLYYRINVLQIIAPPLRKHRADIPHITGEILNEFLPKGTKIRITKHVMAELLQAPWPGNVRELRNVLHRSLLMSTENVIKHLECGPQNSDFGFPQTQSQSGDSEPLISALIRNRGRLEAVAHELNVSVRTVQRRMKVSGLQLRDFRNI